MECPKCGLEIDNKAMVCPNCKKVLKLACPICKTINTTNTCHKCGYVIISKCNKCGKVNQTIAKKCKKCGFDTEKSIILNEANTDDYTMIRIEFPNLEEMKQLLNSAKLYNKFRINLDNIILEYTKSAGIRCRIIDKTYIIRCYKDYTFKGSVQTAINTVVELLNKITEMNCKLTKKKNATIHCNVVMTQKNINNDSTEIDEGFNVNLLYQSAKNKEEKILNTFQVLGDDAVCNVLGNDYRISPLNSIMTNGRVVMISEIDIKNLVKIEFPVEEESKYQDIEIPNFVQNMLVEQDKIDGEVLDKMEKYQPEDDEIYDIDTINFEEIKCDFLSTENSNVIFHIMNKLQSSSKNIIALKAAEIYKPYTIKILNAAFETKQFENVFSITCYEDMKYSPYSFFKDLIATIFEYSVSQKLFALNDYSMFSSVDPDGLIKDLISMNERKDENIENTRYIYYDIFLTVFKIIPKTLIYIEDFDNIDESSLDVMKYIFESFDNLDLSIIISHGKNYSLHKNCNSLLNQPCYTEITLKPDSFEHLIENEKSYYKDIMNDFYFQRIAKYSCGSSMYIDMAIQYLLESGVYYATEDSIKMVNPKTIIIPSTLDKLVSRRINLLQDNKPEIKLLAYAVLLGPRTDMATMNCLEIKNIDNIIEKLTDMGYVYVYNNCLYIPNYSLIRKNLLSSLPKIYLQETAKELLSKIYDENSIPSYIEAYLYNILDDKEKELKELENLSKVNLSLGDFNAYINCTEKIIQLLNEIETSENTNDTILEYKNKLYGEVAEYIQNSEKFHDFSQSILENVEKGSDIDKIIRLCNKMINSALLDANYSYALELMHKVLALLPPSSINPADEKFNKYFFLMSIVHIQILYNIGALKDCVEIGYKVLSVITDDTIEYIKPDYYNIEEFKELIINSSAYVAFANIILMTDGITEYLNILRQAISFIPESFDLFIALNDFMHGRELSIDIDTYYELDKFGSYIKFIIKAFQAQGDNYLDFAETIYKAKIIAQINKERQLELFSDLMIAYAYIKRYSMQKAEFILNQILKETHYNGMTNIIYATWYIMSELYINKEKYNIAYGIINNSQIQLEKNNNASEYLLMLLKYNLYKIMMYNKDYNKAEICINQAIYIANKYGINFDFAINQENNNLTDNSITEENQSENDENIEGE